MNFQRIRRRRSDTRPIHPIEIFEQLPSLDDIPNDLWRGQTNALNDWHEHRTSSDVLVGLNTGAGKTIVGLLMAQSLVNEGLESVVFLCSTIDLVEQTAREADRLGIHHTTRAKGAYSNDLFESGRAFCITTYASLFNSSSVILRNHFPRAVILDDAHVAEKLMRDAFTVHVSRTDSFPLWQSLIALFQPAFEEVSRAQSYVDITDGRQPGLLLVPPGSVVKNQALLAHTLRSGGIDDGNERFAYNYIKDNLATCAVIVSHQGVEITPPFLPTQTLDVFKRHGLRRIYLSATLGNRSDFVRAFGRLPTTVIEPKSDAGNGERLVLFSRYLPQEQLTDEMVDQLVQKQKTVIAVPTYKAGERWTRYQSTSDRNDFSTQLADFRRATSGAFVLVARVDGIDLPHETCRAMIIDDLPRGGSYLERFQWETLGMRNMHAARMANRLAQLFGRINRGRNDYGVFIVNGRDAANWLRNERNLALLPELLQQQVKIGIYLHENEGLKDFGQMLAAIDQVMARDEGWLAFYGDETESARLGPEPIDEARAVENALVAAAESEADFIKHIWEGNYPAARERLESTIENTLRADEKVAGWHNLWLGLCNELESDSRAATVNYARARDRLGQSKIYLKTRSADDGQDTPPVEPRLTRALLDIVALESPESYERKLRVLQERLTPLDALGPKAHEEAVRALGEAFGFSASRPDNAFGVGPDVLWVDDDTGMSVAFELKTAKEAPANYTKDEIGQCHNHLTWLSTESPEHKLLGLILVGPSGTISKNASPSSEMYHTTLEAIATHRNRLLAAIRDIRRAPANERAQMAHRLSEQSEFQIEGMFSALIQSQLQSM